MDLKKELIIGTIVSTLVILLTIFYFGQYQKQKTQFNKISQNGSIVQTLTTSLTNEEITKHNSVSDCWIIVQNSVYNVTQYLSLHPGGQNRIIPYCGQDATSAYVTQGGKGSHSTQAYDDLAKLKLGQLNETVSISNTNNQIQQNLNLIKSSGRKGKNDDD